MGYSNSTRALPVDGSPVFTYKEVTVIWGDWAVTSLFLSILFDQGDKCNNEHAKSEKLRPCNHCNHPLAFVWGCMKLTPEKGEPPTVSRQRHQQDSPNFFNCQYFRLIFPLLRLPGSFCGSLSKGQTSSSDNPIPLLPLPLGRGPSCARGAVRE